MKKKTRKRKEQKKSEECQVDFRSKQNDDEIFIWGFRKREHGKGGG